MEDYESRVRERNATGLHKWEERVSRQYSEQKKKQHVDRLRQLQVRQQLADRLLIYSVGRKQLAGLMNMNILSMLKLKQQKLHVRSRIRL